MVIVPLDPDPIRAAAPMLTEASAMIQRAVCELAKIRGVDSGEWLDRLRGMTALAEGAARDSMKAASDALATLEAIYKNVDEQRAANQ
jgi:hypothetical protein